MNLRNVLIFISLTLSCAVAAAEEQKARVAPATCLSYMSENDVIGVDYTANGDAVEYKRTAADAERLVAALRAKIARDPSITQSVEWKPAMLTAAYWLALCGGTKDCSTKTCTSGSCSYSNIGMAGCKC